MFDYSNQRKNNKELKQQNPAAYRMAKVTVLFVALGVPTILTIITR